MQVRPGPHGVEGVADGPEGVLGDAPAHRQRRRQARHLHDRHRRLEGYAGIDELGYTRERHSQRAARLRGEDPNGLLPGVHRIASLAKRWLLGTHQGSVDEGHLQAYLDEFVFRFNRGTARSRGLVFHRVLGLAVGHEPVRYRDLVVDPRPKPNPPAGRAGWGHPPSLERPPANRPWRLA